jgi:hypothetical protein
MRSPAERSDQRKPAKDALKIEGFAANVNEKTISRELKRHISMGSNERTHCLLEKNAFLFSGDPEGPAFPS